MRRVRETNAISSGSDTEEIWASIKELGGKMMVLDLGGKITELDYFKYLILEIDKLRSSICEIDIVHDASIDKLNQKINILIMKNDALQIEINSLYKSFDNLTNSFARQALGK